MPFGTHAKSSADTGPVPAGGWQLPLHQESATLMDPVGSIRTEANGDRYIMCKASTSALGIGLLVVGVAVHADYENIAQANAWAIGDRSVTFSIGSGSGSTLAYAQDYYKGGYLMVNDETGQGQALRIESSPAITATDTTVTVRLAEPIRVATVAATTEASLIRHPAIAAETSTTLGTPLGVTTHAVTAAYYFWAKCAGMVSVLNQGGTAVGLGLAQSGTTAGAVASAGATSFDVGVAMFAMTDTEYEYAMLNIR